MSDMAALLGQKKLREVTVRVSVGADGDTAAFVMRALPRREYRDLLDEHPPITEGADWNHDTFPPALIAACAVEPTVTVEQAVKAWDEWEAGEMGRLFLTCFQLNEQTAGVSFTSPGSGRTSGSGQKSNTATKKGSRTPSS
jgi:hypothetical protein